MFLYVPSVERAYWSVRDLGSVVAFGGTVRTVHRLAAHLMVAVVFLHMVRVFLTGAFKRPAPGAAGTAAGANRPLNWVVGVALLLVTLLFSFTGYLLPWDQLAFWAITVGTNIASAAPLAGKTVRFALLGGTIIDQNALLRFYVLHCFALPVAALALIAYHLWRIRKDGGLAAVDAVSREREREDDPDSPAKTYSLLGVVRGQTATAGRWTLKEEDYVDAVPHLLRRILLVSCISLLVVTALALVMSAPLEEPANPLLTPNPAKAPWYFLWLQELVTDTTVHIGSFTLNGALVGGVLLPGVLVLLLAVWPWLDKSGVEAAGVWLHRARARQNLVFAIAIAAVVALTIVGTFLRGPYWNFYLPWESWPELPRHF
jgi:quinol-cytochrome oxidoreductase complex cytochrome b subunit